MDDEFGAPLPGTGSREPSPAVSALPGFDPSREPDSCVECPNCRSKFEINAVAAVGKNQRLTFSLHPNHGGMIQSEVIGRQLIDFEKVFHAIAKQDGGKVRTYIDRIGMSADGAFEFSMAILDVRSWPPRDSDGNPKGIAQGDAP